MDAPAQQISIRSSYNFGGVNFTPEVLAAEIRKHIPEFKLTYVENDPRQEIANSWPQSIDASYAKKDWLWKPEFDLVRMTEDMLKNIKKSQKTKAERLNKEQKIKNKGNELEG